MNQNTKNDLETNDFEYEKWEFKDLEFKKDSFHYETSQPYRLWYEYLRLSPIYLLAHKLNTYKDGLSDTEKEMLPDDFDEVLKTYDAFGNVYKYPFRIWWIHHGATLFGMPKSKPVAKPLAYVATGHETDIEACTDALNNYLKNNSPIKNAIQPSYMLIAVPLAGHKREDILQAVSNTFDESYLNEPAAYKLYGERFHIEKLTKGLRLLYTKIENPKMALWRLGAEAKISKTYEDLKGDEKVNDNNVNRTEKLAILTSAMFRNSVSIMENAARGKFPCKDEKKIKLDYLYMRQLINRRRESNARYLNWLVESFRSKSIAPAGMYGDWQNDLDFLNIEYKRSKPNTDYRRVIRKAFYDEQLTIHKRKKSNT
jgi:hypothetical protein